MSDSMVAEKQERLIGRIQGAQSGPTVVAIGGMHGNETAGVEALQKVIGRLQDKESIFNGTLLALRGNVEALSRGVRYIDEDLNRIWFPSIIDKIRRTPASELQSSERRQIKSMLDVLDDYLPEKSSEPAVFADLHSFSASGNMFAITAPKEKNINLFARLHVPLIFGIEKTLRGTALGYYQEQGHTTFALEGGQHRDQRTVHNNTAAMMAMLDEIGCLDTTDWAKLDEHETYLAEENKRLPGQVELVYQHIIEPGDDFDMRPGFENFQWITEGEWLANDRNGKIRAQCDGYLLMPLYQQQGDDGFFVACKK